MLSRLKVKIPFSKWAVPAAVFLLFIFHTFRIVDFHEGDAIDARFRLRGMRKADPRILVLAIDDESIAALGQWPWPRKIHASFLDLLSRFHPRTIFFDFLFTEESPVHEEDERLAGSIRKAGNVILPFFYYPGNPARAQFAIPILKNAAHASGYVNMPDEYDGHLRRAKLFDQTSGKNFYAPAVLMAGLNDPKSLQPLPLERGGNLWINYPGPIDAFRVVSFREIVARAGTEQTDYLEKLLSGKIVLIGYMATGTTDLRSASFSAQTPGVLIHAALLDTLLSGKFLRALPGWAHLVLLLALGLISGAAFRKFSPAKGAAALLVFLISYIFLNTVLFAFLGWILPFYVPLASLFVTYGLTLFAKYTEIRFQREMSEREIQMAARIQEQFLPQTPPKSPFFETAFECRFTKHVGGDLYDWADLGGGRFAFCAGDVSGKGMPAAIYMAKALSDFRSLEKKKREPGEVCTALNRILLENPTAGMFLTFLYGVADVNSKTFRYSCAGHEPLLWFRKRSSSVEILKGAQGIPLAMFETEYETAEIKFEEGDLLLFFTDGVRELRNAKREEWGTERIAQALREEGVSTEGSGKIVERLFERMQEYQGKSPAHDDRTLLCVHFLPQG